MGEEQVILVDLDDTAVGLAPKLLAHQQALLHRAVSCFLFSKDGDLLIQRRASTKYHSGGLWANTCCSHPRHGETPKECMKRRLAEELGIDCSLNGFGTAVYKRYVGDGLTEHEYVHGFAGIFDGLPILNPEEIQDWLWVKPHDLKEFSKENHLAEWFHEYIENGFLEEAIIASRQPSVSI